MWMVGVVTLTTFAGIMVAVGHWVGHLEPNEKTALGAGFAAVLGAAITVAAVSHERREAGICVSLLAAFMVVLAFATGTKSAVHNTTGPDQPNATPTETQPTAGKGSASKPGSHQGTKPARPAHQGGRFADHAEGDIARPAAQRAYSPGATSTPTLPQREYAPPVSNAAPSSTSRNAKAAKGQGSTVTQEVGGSNNAVANDHSHSQASAGTSTPATPPTESTTSTTTVPQSVKQKVGGEGNAVANQGSTSMTGKGDSLTHLVSIPALVTRSAAYRSTLTFTAKVSGKHKRSRHKPKPRRMRRKHLVVRTPPPVSSNVEQQVGGQKNAAANNGSIAVTGEDDPINSPVSSTTTTETGSHNIEDNSNDTESDSHNSETDSHNTEINSHNTEDDSHNTESDSHNTEENSHDTETDSHNTDSGNSSSPIVTVDGSVCNVQVGSSGPVTVSGNTNVGFVSSGGVTETNESESCGNVQVGASGPVSASENSEVGTVSSGGVEEHNTSKLDVRTFVAAIRREPIHTSDRTWTTSYEQ